MVQARCRPSVLIEMWNQLEIDHLPACSGLRAALDHSSDAYERVQQYQTELLARRCMQ